MPLDVHAGRLNNFERRLHHFGADAVARNQRNPVFHRAFLSFFRSRLVNFYTPMKNKYQRWRLTTSVDIAYRAVVSDQMRTKSSLAGQPFRDFMPVRPCLGSTFTGLMIEKFTARLNGFFYGWWMVAVGCGIRMLGGGFHLYGFTVFFLPITQELGLSRAATSLVFSLARAEGAIEGPLAGYLIDRFGPRPMILAGVILSGIGYMLLATIESYYGFLVVYLGVISLSFSAGFMHSPMVLANTWFIRRRALR